MVLFRSAQSTVQINVFTHRARGIMEDCQTCREAKGLSALIAEESYILEASMLNLLDNTSMTKLDNVFPSRLRTEITILLLTKVCNGDL